MKDYMMNTESNSEVSGTVSALSASEPKKIYWYSAKRNRTYWRYEDAELIRREKEYKRLVYATQPWEERRQWILNDLRRTTGIVLTIDEFKMMHVAQKQSCKICRRPIVLCKAKTETHLLATCIDHDHATNQLRGLLCPQCNQAIGLANDDPAILTAARGYLNHYQQAHHDEQLPRCTGRRPNMTFSSEDDRAWSRKLSSSWRNYGYQFTREWFESLLTKQNGRCAICSSRIGLLKKHCVDGIVPACIDHSHTEDCLRGLLCVSCNAMIGLFQENVDIIEASRLYLLSYKTAAQSGNLNAEGNPAWIATEGKTVKKGAA